MLDVYRGILREIFIRFIDVFLEKAALKEFLQSFLEEFFD